ncbi:response regulator [Neorhodopirellula pilleata]|uniref:Polar-differentiation response regulator DivK n=1 Tax=Neorhodopirellula pilleata TaxID=2714738 RepID=A0A5C6AGK8_9BACT|nr:response regulator [Neorhodopirellula pilleata]TWT98739.1 Polar-differentiation response regulator DivK [Neorhodopirellula pilleata]
MPTILLVDDHDDIRDMLTRQLQKHGYTVVTATNGLEAVLATAHAAPSLILMDVNMPELDGYEATIQIREANPENRIPVIALTAYALPDDQARAMAAGCDRFQPKPIDMPKLLEQIRELIANKPQTTDSLS